ncbi:MAG: penicillin-binding protein 2 [bacterium]|nr:penicillin-binding protein 2 [bacterium]
MQEDRTKIVVFVWLIAFLLLLLRLAFLQLWSGKEYKRQASNNYLKEDIISAPRGVIYTKDGKIIADNIATYTIIIDSLSKLSASTRTYLTDIISPLYSKGYVPSSKKDTIKNAPFNIICKLEEQREQFPNLKVKAQPSRRYLYGGTFAHLIGYTGELSKKELQNIKDKTRDKTYKLGSNIGKSGLEKQYEEFLKGKNGARYIEVDARGRELGLLSYDPPEPGYDTWLNIDFDLQILADSIFTASNFSGCCVAMDPYTGEILAWVSRPAFDPNLFSTNLTYNVWRQCMEDPLAPLYDRVMGTNPPGSIFKVVTTAAAVDLGKLHADTYQLLSCPGAMLIGNRTFNCWDVHGATNLIEAITVSCDVFFYQVGMNLGIEPLCSKAKDVGFGKITGVDIPRESKGFVPSEQWYKQKYGGIWGKGLVANLSIGQGEILATPLQILTLISGIATKGLMYTPRILSKIVNSSGQLIYSTSAHYKTLPFSQEAINVTREGMLGAVNAPNGTARTAIIPEIQVAGKTGTAQNPHGTPHAWFTAFAPYENPEICVVVLIENGGHGGSIAAPIAKRIIQKYLSKQHSHT